MDTVLDGTATARPATASIVAWHAQETRILSLAEVRWDDFVHVKAKQEEENEVEDEHKSRCSTTRLNGKRVRHGNQQKRRESP